MWNILILSFICLIISLIYHFYYDGPISVVDNANDDYDYIIVGAGTAGCVIASRLSESQEVSVLLVEAGGYFKWLSDIPLAAPLLQKTEGDWNYATESQVFSSRGLHDQKQFLPRGKGLGGSGQINYLLHSFGIPEDYDKFPKGWSHADLSAYFKRVEETMIINEISGKEKLAKAFLKSEIEIDDKNASFSLARNSLKNSARWSTYHAYLRNAWNRKNLHLLINTVVIKIHFEKLDARSIEINFFNGTTRQIKANKEIILCGGAVNTPKLLLLSGIGPEEELRLHHIPVLSHLEYVGKNLYDHFSLPIYVYLKASASVTLSKLKSIREVIKYYLFGSGLLSSNAIIGTGRSGHSGIVLFGMGSTDEAMLKDIVNYKTMSFRATFPSYADEEQEGLVYLASCLQPKSRGNISLRSAHFADPPIIDPRYLENYYDINCTYEAVKLALKTLKTSEFNILGAKAHIPELEECNDWEEDYENREFIECLARTIGLTSHHPGGTCKMGNTDDRTAVVDEYLRVIGVNRLRIADASVLPSPISGTPNSVIIAIAERAADIIKSENNKK